MHPVCTRQISKCNACLSTTVCISTSFKFQAAACGALEQAAAAAGAAFATPAAVVVPFGIMDAAIQVAIRGSIPEGTVGLEAVNRSRFAEHQREGLSKPSPGYAVPLSHCAFCPKCVAQIDLLCTAAHPSRCHAPLQRPADCDVVLCIGALQAAGKGKEFEGLLKQVEPAAAGDVGGICEQLQALVGELRPDSGLLSQAGPSFCRDTLSLNKAGNLDSNVAAWHWSIGGRRFPHGALRLVPAKPPLCLH